VIASASFGASRDFVVRRRSDHSQKIVFPLKHGTLLIMKGELQHDRDHAAAKRRNVRQSRFNMTFRRIGA
jgi:alkylated DNA repair dioxygenase AlkB